MEGKRNKFAKIRNIMLICALITSALSIISMRLLPSMPPGALEPPASPVITDSDDRVLHAALNANGEWLMPVSLDVMGRWTRSAAVTIEDKRFYSHGGIDFVALCRAAIFNLISKGRRSGASTITSQVIRLSLPARRTYLTKLVEFWRAHQIESRMTKDEILELYLNIAPFGSNIRGVEAASYMYFGKRARELSLAESAELVSMVRAPSRLRPDRNYDAALSARNSALKKLVASGVIPGELYYRAVAEGIPRTLSPMPRSHLHIAEHIRDLPQSRRARSTIDGTKQIILEEKLKGALVGLPQSITAAAVLVDNKSLGVVAYVGNARFGSGAPGAWIDCASAPRSPGSTLKPVIYAMAFDRGIITPASLLADTPLSFRGAAPRNFDLGHRGPVSARSALADSLNIPAVRVLRRLGFPTVLDAYRRAGLSHMDKDAFYYADSLALGGCEATAAELAGAYAALCRGGGYAPPRWTESERVGDPIPIASPAASYVTLDILRDERRLIPLYQELFASDGTQIAFKTGTSYALRDAWTAACTPDYTLVVWFGDVTAASHHQLLGLGLAAPVAVDILKELNIDRAGWFKRPAELKTRRVCTLSGLPPGRSCPNVIEDYYIEGVSPAASCKMHAVERGRLLVKWPPELAAWNERYERASGEQGATTLKILAPRANSRVISDGGAVRLALKAEGGGSVHYWFLNSEFLREAKRGEEIFIDAPPGDYRLGISDGASENATLRFSVVREKDLHDPQSEEQVLE